MNAFEGSHTKRIRDEAQIARGVGMRSSLHRKGDGLVLSPPSVCLPFLPSLSPSPDQDPVSHFSQLDSQQKGLNWDIFQRQVE